MTKRKTDGRWVGLLAAALALRFVVYWQQFRFYFRTDDIVPLAYPAYLAGQDWSTFLSGKMMYYGFGYYWIFAPLFRWISSPKLLLALIVGFNGLVTALTSVLIYHLLVTRLGFSRSAGTCFFALVPTMFLGDVSARNMFWFRTDNEMPLFLACWLLVWLLLAAHRLSCDAGAPRVKKAAVAVGVSLVLCWALTVHERALALFLTVAVVELLLFLLKRKWLLSPLPFYASLAAGFVMQRYLRARVIRALWAGTWPSANTSAFSRVSLWFLRSFTAMKAMLMILFGNLHSFLIKSFGLPAFAAVAVVVWLAGAFTGRIAERKKNGSRRSRAEETEWIHPGMLVMLVFGLCTMVIIGGNAVRWGSMLYEGLASGKVVYGYKGICYSRYYYVFCGPILFGLFAFCHGSAVFRRGWMEAGWAVWAVVEVVFFAFIFPYCVNADTAEGTNYVRRSIGTYFFPEVSDEKKLAISVALMLTAMVLGSIALARRQTAEGARGNTRGLLLAAVFLTLVFVVDRGVQARPAQKPSFSFANAQDAAWVLEELSRKDALPERIYLERNVWNYTLRFLLRELCFVRGVPEEADLLTENVIVTKRKSDGTVYQSKGYESFDAGKYRIWTNCKKTLDALSP